MRIMLCIVAACFMAGCQPKKKVTSIFSTQSLPIETFQIDVTRDTLLTSKNGTRIFLPKGTLKSDSAKVKLDLKEAYSMQQMVLGGLKTVTTDGKALQSGGMFYLAPSGTQKVEVVKPIQMLIPTDNKVDSMKLFTANEKEDGITWEKPFQFKVKSTGVQDMPDGKALFQSNCVTCHTVLKDAIGPALANITKMRTMEYLYVFTNNWEVAVAKGDCDAVKIKDWSGTAMSKFNFSPQEIEKIYKYIELESTSPNDNDERLAFYDSCQKYKKMKLGEEELLSRKYKLKNKSLISETDANIQSTLINTIPSADTIEAMVETVQPTSEFYDIQIQTFGWYNIDIITDDLPNVEMVSIKVPIVATYEDYVKTYLIIPNKKIKLDAHLKGSNYVFGTKDDSLKLVLGDQGYILSMGEKDGKFIYSKTAFKIAKQQTIPLQIKEASIYDFNADMRRMGWTGLDIKAAESRNKGEVELINYQIQKIESMKPSKDCDCSDLKKKSDTEKLWIVSDTLVNVNEY